MTTTDAKAYTLTDIAVGDRVAIYGNGGALGAGGNAIQRGFAIEVTKIHKRWNSGALSIEGYHLTTTGARRKGEPTRYAQIAAPSGANTRTGLPEWALFQKGKAA